MCVPSMTCCSFGCMYAMVEGTKALAAPPCRGDEARGACGPRRRTTASEPLAACVRERDPIRRHGATCMLLPPCAHQASVRVLLRTTRTCTHSTYNTQRT